MYLDYRYKICWFFMYNAEYDSYTEVISLTPDSVESTNLS